METFKLIWFLLQVLFHIIYDLSVAAYSDSILVNSTTELANYTSISDFRVVNRRVLYDCPSLNPHIKMTVTPDSNLPNDGFVTVTIEGINFPSKNDWVGMLTASHEDLEDCPFNKLKYAQTGDLKDLPLLCHYPIKAPCVLRRSNPIWFANPKTPLHGHISSVNSDAKSMKLTWVSGDNAPQYVKFWSTTQSLADGNTRIASQVNTFTQKDMCTSAVKSPAKDFGWHDPGFIHSAVMTGLQPLTTYTYRYGSDSVGWSHNVQFRTPPASGADALSFISFGDYGRTPRDQSDEHFIQPGAASVTKALKDEVASGNFDSIFHIGDISYATGFLVEWDYFLHQISPYASKISYMTAIGNHERDYVDSGSIYTTLDSGGECGVPYETYFPMPVAGKDKPWYSIEQGLVHFTVISSEHSYTKHSKQRRWIVSDLASVDRSRTPWVVFMSHRPLYTSLRQPHFTAREDFGLYIEPLLLKNKVDLVLVAHVHNYERSCAVYQGECKSRPVMQDGMDAYNTGEFTAPVHLLIGMSGFTLNKFESENTNSWSLTRIAGYGYVRFNVTRTELLAEFVNSQSRKVADRFRLTKNLI